MKGTILEFSVRDGSGIISGDDGVRYTFLGQEWRSASHPRSGLRVDYAVQDAEARAVYILPTAPEQASLEGTAQEVGFYKSSDEKVIAGVCAGLAHKWKLSRGGLRAATFVITLFVWLPLFVYIGCWLAFPTRPTAHTE